MNKKTNFVKNILMVVIVLVSIIWLNTFLIEHRDTVQEIVSQFGYIGMFVLAIVSGFNIAIPLPAIGFYPVFTELGYQPILIILILSLGMTIGDSIGYLLGQTGRGFLERTSSKKILKVFHRLYVRHQALPFVLLFFYAAFVPLPNELLIIPMSIAGYRFWQMGAVLFLGNIVFNIVGAFGISAIVSFI
ncbi:MAG: hypothetical protein CO030_03730 [Candidatus Magasanikbacteria bacterium CG_4_9_14_0_2_um_filter_42_11]|uniref:DedA family protein n=1 Tax=Candidatus Magasanikbacteria bacterium CG_4_9_14_0_2_um_filter_42_11 TaxID=1974643 RepID=A0A2M8F953_9BACT|nr:MAG: hypothetical protein COU34_04460 [Candidatus Magasanikbacteria bacterium CG10_big_fil_rev_8_21_14_0_10_43_9]PIY92795.1 MAG: hypothetical protein COY70_01365 [Candidatus Magasanikbacteria bacterium CG_4_10_14_0_8_um_filter_42_12]PJC52285.1 MAG: hypothetical protein CO030_03730 [Candidatus Magasanikbacteria bacterium CG_4_9_14_0_2_um_filter_42_11]